ncbi:ATP-binding protein [Pseudoalteromonas sp. YIC-656]|uniref:HAMP domain-containing hybrid sensor histidine kinase/response regulator n=1 Tax=Pseudoalteromonas pernae TaxID=3118054 RepID=UPI003242ACE7
MPTPKFSAALFRTIVFISILPMLIVVAFFANQFYNSTLDQAQQTLTWRAKNDALAIRQILYKATIENERLATSKAIAQLPVRILYSQFALTQLQTYVKTNANTEAAMVIDSDGFIVEGYPLSALNLNPDITQPIAEHVMANKASMYFALSLPDVNSNESEQVVYIGLATMLSLEQESLSTPFENTGVLLTLKPAAGLLNEIKRIEQEDTDFGERNYFLQYGDHMLGLAQQSTHQGTLEVASPIVDIVHGDTKKSLNLLIKERQSPHLHALKNSLAFSAILLLSLALCAILLARWLVHKLNQPLDDISELSQEYAKGNYDFNVRKFNYSEFQSLSNNLQSMAVTIEQQIESLQEEKHRAQVSERAKSLFLANMSHEIRTPMNGIFGYLQLLQSSSLEPQQSDYIRQIRLCTEMLLTVINDVLDFSKIEANKIIMEKRPCDVKVMIQDVLSLFQPSCESKGISCSLNVDDDTSVYVLCDEIRVKQVLINLVSNAVKFTSKGGIEIGLHHRIDNNTCYCQFYVKDTGVGIPKDKQSQLFQPFVQAQESTTREFGGTGLGLTICKRLVELMGGCINLESEQGKGSKFIIELDFELSDTAPVVADLTADTTLAEYFDGTHVLVAEDNPINQCVIERFLTDLGIKVTTVENGQEAVDAQAKQRFDLILMDIQMPVMDGLSAARRICECDPNHEPIIAVSANAMSQDVDEALRAGMQDHLAKPIEHPVLVAMLSKWLVKKEANQA